MIPKLVILLAVTLSVRGQCAAGCLKCSAANTCLLCDTSTRMFLLDGTCTQITDSNCAIAAQNGTCVQCLTNFYLDLNEKNCVAVSTANAGKNCALFSSTQACLFCKEGFYPSGGSCVTVANPVQQCQFYYADAGCLSCIKGYILALNQTTCLSTATAPNCMFYTYGICKQCAPNYTMNYNAYFTSFATITYLNSLVTPIADAYVGINTAVPLSVCQGGSITNCVAYSNPVNCTQCATNFFLLNNTCWPNPLPVIFQCATYSSLTTCTACKTGFYLSQNTCLAIVPITGCISYSTTASTTTCLQCDSSSFLNSTGQCPPRVNSLNVQNCQTFTINADTCTTCISGYNVTADLLNCLAMIPNCVTYANYAQTTATTTAFSCSVCQDNYFKTTANSINTCNKGTTANCAAVQATADVCTACLNGFYLSNAACIAHINIANCLTYHATTANTCTACATGYYNFKYNTICASVTTISFCTAYSVDGTTCTACAATYYLSNNACVQIPSTFPNCVSFTGTACSACGTGFMVNTMVTPNVCVALFDYLTLNCVLAPPGATATWSEPPGNPLTCNICGPNARAYTPSKTEAVCVLTTQLALYSGFAAVANCVRYGMSYAATPNIICMACAPNYFISGYKYTFASLTTTSCVSSCVTSAGANVVVPDDLLGFVNVCVSTTSNANPGPSSSTTCQKMIRTTLSASTDADFSCISPVSGSLLSYSQGNFINYEANTASPTNYLITPVDYFHGFTLADAASNTFVPLTFNHRGLKFSIVATPTLLSGVSLANCDFIWTIGSAANTRGSAYSNGGGSAGSYTALSGGQGGCLRCNFGFRVQFNVQAATGNLAIPNCVTMSSTCLSSTVMFGGLPTYLNHLYSCHSCGQSTGQNTFPTIYMEMDATSGALGNFLQFSLPAAATWTANAPQGFRCDLPPTTVTTSNTAATSGNQVANCGAYGVLTPVTTFGSSTVVAVLGSTISVCLACATGYFPIYFSNTPGSTLGSTTYIPPYAVATCNQANKCDPNALNTPFNSCGRCTRAEESLPSPNFYAYSDFRLINCLPVNTKNCFILNTAGSPTLSASVPNACGVCMAGFFLNEDKMCETLTIPSQVTTATFTNSFFVTAWTALSKPYAPITDSAIVRTHYLLSFFTPQFGISSCATGYTLAVPSHRASTLCVGSSYLTTGTLVANSNFITNCLQYFFAQVSGKFVCQKCMTGFIPVSSFLACVAVVPSCVYAQTAPNTALCAQCNPGLVNIAGVCSSSIIANCQTYVNNPTSFSATILTCSVCAPGYYKSSDSTTCLVGSILNCQTYTTGSATACTACKDGYMKLTLTGNLAYCYPIPSSLNCLTITDQTSSTANNAQIICTSCALTATQAYGTLAWNPTTNAAKAQTLCMPFNPISYCATYSQTNTVLASNTFACLTCSNGYYLSSTTNTCILRTVLPVNCTTYSPTADLCTACSGNSFLATNGLSCIPYPNGIYNCLVYTSNTTCSLCASGTYLSGNQCLVSTFIANCASYSGNNVCRACQSGYYLQNPTVCIQATATGCFNYTSVSACATCPAGYIKSTSNGVTNCVSANVPNCAVIDTSGTTPTCITCNAPYYADSAGVCQQAPSPIANCQVYASNITCAVCSSGSVLNALATQCVINGFPTAVDPNCAQSAISATPLCAVCAFGYYFVNGTCQACSVASLSSGCWSCDPNNASTCLLCATGYYQTSTGSCVEIPVPQTNTTTNTTTTDSVMLAPVLALIWMLSLLT